MHTHCKRYNDKFRSAIDWPHFIKANEDRHTNEFESKIKHQTSKGFESESIYFLNIIYFLLFFR